MASKKLLKLLETRRQIYEASATELEQNSWLNRGAAIAMQRLLAELSAPKKPKEIINLTEDQFRTALATGRLNGAERQDNKHSVE